MMRLGRFLLGATLLAGACTPMIEPPGVAVQPPNLETDSLVMADGTRLSLQSWLPSDGPPTAVILALHGFNDYANFFDDPGQFLAQRFRIASYAYDQRGFGRSRNPGTWAGVQAYADDLRTAAGLLKQRHPDLPLYLLGESMGGAVVIVAAADGPLEEADGVILAAPAVWGRITMPWYQRAALWIGAHTVPWMTVTGRGLGIKPSDNIEMLIELGRDPLVIKETRIGTLYGLVNLMDAGLEKAAGLRNPALILYGEKDEFIPKLPTAEMLGRLPEGADHTRRVALYEGGYHMLLRDLPAATVWKDIGAWIRDREAPLPSKADTRDIRLLTAGS